MRRREFLKIGAMSAAIIPFISSDTCQSADVEIFVEEISNVIEHNRLSNSQLYFNHFYQPQHMVWVWTPWGWTIQAKPVYLQQNIDSFGFQNSLQGYYSLQKKYKNIKQISIHNADCIYIFEDGTIKIYDKTRGKVKSNISSDIPTYIHNLNRVNHHYLNRRRGPAVRR